MAWWITDTSFGQRLKLIRRYRRMTQKELGILLGYPEKQADVRIAQYEKNARTPKQETVQKLAEVLNVSPAVFSQTICASREDLLQSMYWLFLLKGGGEIYDCETEFAKNRMKLKLGAMSPEEFLDEIFAE
ncbi:MAG: helix-turn-helix domain-containing protein [Fusicatenibacter sp.]